MKIKLNNGVELDVNVAEYLLVYKTLTKEEKSQSLQFAESDTRICKVCGKRLDGKRVKFCSRRCTTKYHNQKARTRKRLIVGQKTAKNCERCNREFTPDRRSMRYCSAVCRWTSYNERLKARRNQKVDSGTNAGEIIQNLI